MSRLCKHWSIRAFALCVSLMLPIQWAQAQLSVTTKNSNLGKVIQTVKTQSDYRFFYDDQLSSTPVPNVSLKDVPLKTLLQRVLKDTSIAYRVEDNVIYLTKKAVSQEQVNRLITGTVVDASEEPLIGVSIKVEGTNTGTITDFDGKYTLRVTQPNARLVFTYVGYTTVTKTLGQSDVLDVVMGEDNKMLSEVVVTALGIKREEKALSYNVQQVGGEDLLTNKDANFINSLSGKVAGVNINSSSSGVGGASKVVMRGTKTIAQSSNALYVIDGVPMFNFGDGGETGAFGSSGSTEAIADINPEDIESVSVLTGAAAAALYGSNASNGAIVITTKKGTVGKTSLTVTSGVEMISTFVTPDFQDKYGTGNIYVDGVAADKSWGEELNAQQRTGYNPTNDFLRTGMVNTNNVSLSTGNEKNQTYLSAATVFSEGIVPNNDYDRYNFTFRNTTSLLNDKMTLDLGGSYIRQTDRNMVNQGQYANPLVTAYLFPRGDDWNDIRMYERYDSQRRISTQYWPQGLDEYTGQNPYWIAYRNLRENKKDRYMFNAGVTYDINDWMNVMGRVRVDNSTNKYEKKFYATSNMTLTNGSENGSYEQQQTDTKQTYADLLLNINKSLTEDLFLTMNLGTSISDMKQSTTGLDGPIRDNGLPNVFNLYQLDEVKTKRKQTGWQDQTQSVFASAELGYKSSYYLTLTGRNDWASQLAGPHSNKSSFFYPSIGTSFVLSEIFELPEFISFAKARASYASVGLPFARFLANPTYEWDNDNKVWQNKSHYPLYDLKPEKTNSFEVGLSAKFWNHVDLDLTYYVTRTLNQTFDPQISVSSGYSTLYVQTGNVENKGFEFALGYHNKWGDFAWRTNYTLSTNKNKIIELVDNYVHPETGLSITKERLDVGGIGYARFILKKGGTLGDLYSTADLTRDENGDIYVDENGKMSVDNNVGDIKLGSVLPDANMAWSNEFNYKNIGLRFMVAARLGGVVYSATQAAMDTYGVSKASADARDAGGVLINGGDRVTAYDWYYTTASKTLPQYYTYSATNVRLQELALSYTLPRAKLAGIADVTLSVVGKNLWMIYNKAPFDPEAIASTGNYYQGIDNFMMPSLRTVGFNVRMKF